MDTNDGRVTTPSGEEHDRFKELLQSLDAIVWEMDACTWRFTYVSERAVKILGYPLSEWYENPNFWQDVLLHPEDRSWCVDYCLTATNECRDHAFLYRARAADGRLLWLKDLVRVVPGEDGRAAHMRGVMLDVTDEMPADAAARALSQSEVEAA